MTLERRIARTVVTADPAPGFLGAGHLAAAVVAPGDFERTDPFILLMDDWLDVGAGTVGGAHPHAGFETVTFLAEGSLYDAHEGGVLHEGDVQWMTAGRGIIHGEHVEARGKVRILQLWLTLPKAERWTAPGFQDIRLETIPVLREPGIEVRVHSGRAGGLQAATRNHVPVTLTDIRLTSGASFEQELPASYNGFVYLLDGSAQVGSAGAVLTRGQVGWLDRPAGDDASVLRIKAGSSDVRLVLYAAQPQGDPIVASGPFVADSKADIARLLNEYRAGQFERLSMLRHPTLAGDAVRSV